MQSNCTTLIQKNRIVKSIAIAIFLFRNVLRKIVTNIKKKWQLLFASVDDDEDFIQIEDFKEITDSIKQKSAKDAKKYRRNIFVWYWAEENLENCNIECVLMKIKTVLFQYIIIIISYLVYFDV